MDKLVNPHRYRLSSGAELVGHRFLGNTPYTITLKIWIKVKEVEHTAVIYLSGDDQRLKAFSNGDLAEHELVNEFFAPSEQVNKVQASILKATLELAMGDPTQSHVGTGGRGSTYNSPWNDNDKEKSKKSTYGKKRI